MDKTKAAQQGGVSRGASRAAGGPQACFPAVLPNLRPMTFNSVQPKRMENLHVQDTELLALSDTELLALSTPPAQAPASSQPPFLDSGPVLQQCERRY